MLRALWNVVWTWVDDFIKQKIIICGYNDCQKTLLEYISEDVLEEQYGGKIKKIVDKYFPPE